MPLLIGLHDLSPACLAEYSARALMPDSLYALTLDEASHDGINRACAVIDGVAAGSRRVYGINTGVGLLCTTQISPDKFVELQHNIILSHCCGVGEPLPRDLVMMMWVILLNSIAKGHRGVRLESVDFILQTLNAGLLAVVPSQGSVGASGDLAPSAHAAAALLGEGRCTMPVDGRIEEMPSCAALQRLGLSPWQLAPKEGLSLINGTQLTTALATKAWYHARRLLDLSNLAAALSIAALRCQHMDVAEPLWRAHKHPGTLHCGLAINAWLGDHQAKSAPGHDRVQDPYSLRCAPQVHGAVWEDVQACESILQREINASTDNPLVFADTGVILHGGNFHAIYPARVADRLASALTTLGSISERRINLMMDNEKSGLPYFLINNGGLHSGLMMMQTVAASLVSECKMLSFPASVDSIPTNCNQEDHVSMGPIAGRKALKIVDNVYHILAIELLSTAQAIDLLKSEDLSERLRTVHLLLRSKVPFLERDRMLANDVRAVEALLRADKFF
jgi:histidine ammonia-lyase